MVATGIATFQNARSPEITATSYGGGIDNKGSVTLTDSTLSGNTASSGGGIHNFIDDYVTMTNCTLSGE